MQRHGTNTNSVEINSRSIIKAEASNLINLFPGEKFLIKAKLSGNFRFAEQATFRFEKNESNHSHCEDVNSTQCAFIDEIFEASPAFEKTLSKQCFTRILVSEQLDVFTQAFKQFSFRNTSTKTIRRLLIPLGRSAESTQE